MSKERVAEILLNTRAVTLNPSKPYGFVSGILSPIYCDNRILMSYVEEREEVYSLFVKLIQESHIDVIAGIESAGIPWASWISDKIKKPMIYVRKRTKDHGKENLIEGLLTKDQKVGVIEDLVSTGGSSIEVVRAIRQAGGNVNNCYAIFTYEFDKSKRLFTEENCRLSTLTDFSTLIQVARTKDYITEEERELALSWNKNPEQWGR